MPAPVPQRCLLVTFQVNDWPAEARRKRLRLVLVKVNLVRGVLKE